MQPLNHLYYAALLEEQRLKHAAFDEQIKLELLNLTETEAEADKIHRQEYMQYLANRILQINVLMEPWLNCMQINLTKLA
jgi:hypothetical protein